MIPSAAAVGSMAIGAFPLGERLMHAAFEFEALGQFFVACPAQFVVTGRLQMVKFALVRFMAGQACRRVPIDAVNVLRDL